MPRTLDLSSLCPEPIRLASLEALQAGDRYFVRARAASGAEGLIEATGRMAYLHSIFQQLVVPHFVGQDARDLETLVDTACVARSNYKLAGLALYVPIAWAEFAVLDLVGKVIGRSVCELLSGRRRDALPVYLSSMRRDTSPVEEIEWLGQRVRETGARAVKIKIGGRMSANADATPGRTEQLVALARRTFGDRFTLYVDANGSYDAPHAIRVGHLLADHGVAMYEEPCPFEDFEATQAVADALALAVSGGEQDHSLAKFAWYVAHRGLDVLQPDLQYNGGLIRSLRVARLAQGAGLPVTPHSAAQGSHPAAVLHFLAALPNPGPFMEFNAHPQPPCTYFSPRLDQVVGGLLPVPDGPGFGLTYDPALLARARVL